MPSRLHPSDLFAGQGNDFVAEIGIVSAFTIEVIGLDNKMESTNQNEREIAGWYSKPAPGSAGERLWKRFQALERTYPTTSNRRAAESALGFKFHSTQTDLSLRFSDVIEAVKLKRHRDACFSLNLEGLFTRILDRLKVKLDQLFQLYVLPFDIFQVIPICLDAWAHPGDVEKLDRVYGLKRILFRWRTKVKLVSPPQLSHVPTATDEGGIQVKQLDRKKKPVVRRKTKPRGLTPKQTKAVELFGEYEGDFSRIAKALGLDPKTVRQHVKVAFKKLSMTPESYLRNPKFQQYRHDGRGQVAHPSADSFDPDSDGDDFASDADDE